MAILRASRCHVSELTRPEVQKTLDSHANIPLRDFTEREISRTAGKGRGKTALHSKNWFLLLSQTVLSSRGGGEKELVVSFFDHSTHGGGEQTIQCFSVRRERPSDVVVL